MKNFDGKRYFHPWNESKKTLLTVLKWQLTSEKVKWPRWIKNATIPQIPKQPDPEQIAVTFINHATVYFQHAGLHCITDPHWSVRASPVSFAGPKRVREPGVPIDQLPGLDIVFVSHNHYDHLDVPTLKKLNTLYQPLFLIPVGDAKLMKEAGITRFKELNWWNQVDIGNGCKATFVPVKHWSARGMHDRNESLWGGFVITSANKKIFFAGDTGYCDIFKTLSEKFGAFDLSLIPIGAYEPRWFMRDSHMNPEEAVLAHIDLQSKKSLGIHFGLWQLTDEGFDQPVKDLRQSKTNHHVHENDFFILDLGETKIVK